jgi:beta-mannosidase
MLNAPAVSLHAQAVKEHDTWQVTVTNTGPFAALNVRLDDSRDTESSGYVYFDDNYFSLIPGESRTIEARWSGVKEENRQLELAGWNTDLSLLM